MQVVEQQVRAVYESSEWNASTPNPARGDDGNVRLRFPMPPWAYRECFYGDGERTESQCNGRGSCQLDGACVCADGYTGRRCATPPKLPLMATDDVDCNSLPPSSGATRRRGCPGSWPDRTSRPS